MQVRDLMLVDLDAFYVSVEQRKNPALVGKPVIVGGVPGERGVVCSASYEARGYGVRAGMPLAQAAALCPKAVFLHGDHADYETASKEVMAILRAFAPVVQPLSMDEALVDVTGCDRLHFSATGHQDGALAQDSLDPRRVSARLASRAGRCASGAGAGSGGGGGTERPWVSRSWLDVATVLHDDILGATGLSVSIGIGGTRSVASVAAALAKPAGALEVARGEEAAFLAALPVELLPGVGPRMREALARFNLHTIGDLARIPEDLLDETFGKVGVALSRRARGLEDDPFLGDKSPVSDGRPLPKSISRETSFERDTADRAVIGGMLSYLAQRATAALRSERMLARGVCVRLRYSDFKTVEARRRFERPTDLDDDVLRAVEDLWPKRWDRRVRLRLVGVGLIDLEPVGERQLDLFADRLPEAMPLGESARRMDVPARGTIDDVIDGLRSRHGFGAVFRGRAIDCLGRLSADRRGLQLRTPSCSA